LEVIMRHAGLLCILAGIAVAMPAVAQPLAPTVGPEPPIAGEPPRLGAPPPGAPVAADVHVASVQLGFERGIGPAPGQTVTWQGASYLVVDAVASEGRPTFGGGSRFVITSSGGSLEIGLRAIDRPSDRQVARATH
jgi:hypothetical protein